MSESRSRRVGVNDARHRLGAAGDPDAALAAWFTAAELEPLSTRRDPVPGLAARLAAKEALLELAAERRGVAPESCPRREVEVLTLSSGAPRIRVSGAVAEAVAGLEIHVSLSHEGPVAAALVVLEVVSQASSAATSSPTAGDPTASAARLATRSSGS